MHISWSECWEEGGQEIELDICMALVSRQVDYNIQFWDSCLKGDVK